jgi:hypothetical protein
MRVTGSAFDHQDGSPGRLFQMGTPTGATIPGVVPSNDSAETWWRVDDAQNAGLDLTKPLVARVFTATGEFTSRPTRLFLP